MNTIYPADKRINTYKAGDKVTLVHNIDKKGTVSHVSQLTGFVFVVIDGSAESQACTVSELRLDAAS